MHTIINLIQWGKLWQHNNASSEAGEEPNSDEESDDEESDDDDAPVPFAWDYVVNKVKAVYQELADMMETSLFRRSYVGISNISAGNMVLIKKRDPKNHKNGKKSPCVSVYVYAGNSWRKFGPITCVRIHNILIKDKAHLEWWKLVDYKVIYVLFSRRRAKMKFVTMMFSLQYCDPDIFINIWTQKEIRWPSKPSDCLLYNGIHCIRI